MRKFVAFLLIIAFAAGIVWLVKSCDKDSTKEPQVKSAEELAFKPAVPPVDIDTVLDGRDIVIYRNVGAPVQAARLITGKYRLTIHKAAKEAAEQYGLDDKARKDIQYWLSGIMYIESGGDPFAKSAVGARGAVQIMPRTARSVGLHVDVQEANRLMAKLTAHRVYYKKVKAMYKSGGNAKQQRLRGKILTKEERIIPTLIAKIMRVDERLNPYKCIRGGAHYFASLYKSYGDGYWAAAGYHGGGGRTSRTRQIYEAESGRTDYTYMDVFFCSPKQYPKTYQRIQELKTAKRA